MTPMVCPPSARVTDCTHWPMGFINGAASQSKYQRRKVEEERRRQDRDDPGLWILESLVGS
jgi:hypothetical protein